MSRPTRFANGLSTHPEAPVAVGEALGAVVERVGTEPDLAVVFASGPMISALADIVDSVERLLCPRIMLAVASSGVLGGAEEVEAGTGLSIWAGRTGPVTPVRLEVLPGGGPAPSVIGLPPMVSEPEDPRPVLLLIADPFSFPIERFLDDTGGRSAHVAVVGGMASAGRAPGENRLWLNGTEHTDGAIGVLLPGDAVDVVVSQGCRPIGLPWVITDGEGQMIRSLGGRPAVERLDELVAGLSPTDRALAAQGLHIGFVANEHGDQFGTGDFLVRGVLGSQRSTGAIAVAGNCVVGQAVQFHVREPASATADLVALMPSDPAAGSLVFTCNERGTTFFDCFNHDASLVEEHTSGGVAGMFCAGEVGPVGTENAIHSFTATVLMFR